MTAEQLLERLVGFPSVAGSSNEELATWVATLLDDAGCAVEVSAGTRDDGVNLHAVLGPADQPGLVLSAHTDVVAVDGQPWTHDPFAVMRADGRLYGRGTADMKGFLAAALAVIGDISAGSLHRPVHVVLSSDEELGCQGIRPLLGRLPDAVAAGSLTVVGEPTRLRVVERHKGKLALRLDVRGRAGHSSRAPEAVNAVEYAARLIAGLDGLRAELGTEAVDERFAVPHATLSTGPIAGGVALNIVPDACTFELEARLLPGQRADRVRRWIEDAAADLSAAMRAVDSEAGIAVTTITEYPALGGRAGGGDPALVSLVAACAGSSAGGAVDYGTEAGLLEETIGGTVVVCGPGDMAQAHRADEFLEVAQLEAGVAFLRRLVAAHCCVS